MRIALDMDGVICKGPWIEPELRTHETYQTIEPYDEDTFSILGDLVRQHECYIITARKYVDARWSIKKYLLNQQFFWRDHIAGIITGIPAIHKYHLAGIMRCDLIVDDHPLVWKSGRNGDRPEAWLMDNPDWLKNQDCTDSQFITDCYRRVRSWKELGERIASLNSRLISKS